jgi:hypothetical protein
MWNYLLGVKPPSESEWKKRKFESTKEYYKGYVYDKDKHARKYLPEWEKGRPWLKNVDHKGMFLCFIYIFSIYNSHKLR